jgi:putative transposase
MKLRQLITVYLDKLPLSRICSVLNYSRASYYRDIVPKKEGVEKTNTKRNSQRKLSDAEEREILKVLNSERFCDMAPAEIYTILLDEGQYYCSIRTMYRILQKSGQSLQRRQREPGNYTKPELLAIKPNEIWSWDITKLKGPAKWQYFLLYTIMDIYSRYIVGWLIAERESDEIARELIAETILRQEIVPETLTLHADRGSSMKSNTVAQLLCDLQVRKTHSRPHVSNDNPFSESNFKTLKYRPDFPERFGSIHDARAHYRRFISWYNTKHCHAGIAMLTPEQVHYQNWKPVLEKRQQVLVKAAALHPERFVKGTPVQKSLSAAVWINKPNETINTQLLEIETIN